MHWSDREVVIPGTHAMAPLELAPRTDPVPAAELCHSRGEVARAIRELCARPRSHALPPRADAPSELRDALGVYVRQLRAAGLRAEQVVVDVKQLLDEGGARDAGRPSVLRTAEAVVSWAIGQYYE